MSSNLSFLNLVRACDSFSGVDEHLVPWRIAIDGPIIGLLRKDIVTQLIAENNRTREMGGKESWNVQFQEGQISDVSFAFHLADDLARSRIIKEMCERWRDEGLFEDVIGPRVWRSELYPVYIDPLGPRFILDASLSRPHSNDDKAPVADKSNHAFDIERAAAALFGVVRYGVHMTIYEEGEDGSCRIWVPTRAKSKQTWPGYLDNSVAGGMSSGMGALESLVKESMEEASIEEHIVREYARAVGSVSYFYQTTKGWLQPEVQYVYDLRVPTGVDAAPLMPKPLDGEVESFELLPLVDVVSKMRAGLFKPNCALVLVDFLVRHGLITADNEPRFMEIVTRMHRQFDFNSIIRKQ